jgi:hypothetical protein
MPTKKNAAWAEIVQLIPVISLALPFIVRGSVDLSQAGTGFLLGAGLSLPITALVVAKKELLNPILLGTNLWLWLGALAFAVPIEALERWLVATQAFGLFVAALGAGIVTTLGSPHGYIACRSTQPNWTRRMSLALLALTTVLAWAWALRADIRLGGGLPFIVLNVARRAACLRAP